MSLEIILFFLIIIFISSLIRSILGFGDALIAMPLLSFILPLKFSTPIVAIIAIFLSLSIIIKDWKSVNFKNVWQITLFSIIGIPFGILMLDKLNENLIRLFLGLILIVFSIYNLTKPNLYRLRTKKFDWFFGLISGFLGGAYNTNGPPILIYGSLRRWEMVEFRTTLQAIFFPTNMFIVLGHIVNGNVQFNSLMLLSYSIPIIFVSIILGKVISNYISKEKFTLIVFYVLIILGVLLIFPK